MAASTTRTEKQQQGDSRQVVAAAFDVMHSTLVSEAHAMARNVLTVAFRPDHAADRADNAPRAVVHEFLGIDGWWRRTCQPWGRRSWLCTRRGCEPSGPPSSVRCRGRRRRRNKGAAPGGVEIDLPGGGAVEGSGRLRGSKKRKKPKL
jgi:hypothetical protein